MKGISTIQWAIFLCTLSFNAFLYPAELPLIISVCAYNASPWLEKNLDSICTQEYTNFHIVYIDDASQDNTVAKVQQYITTHNLDDKITLIANPTRQRKMKNIYSVFHNCPDESIIVQVDADDWLAHTQVFAQINAAYNQNNIWLTYGQFQVYPTNEQGYCRPVPIHVKNERDYRGYRFVYTHLRTFYGWLAKSIKLQDLIAEQIPGYNGKFFPVANDNATYFPMLEMCGEKYTFIPDVLYIHNHSNPNYGRNIELDLYIRARTDIRARPKYPVVIEPILARITNFNNAQADFIILSSNSATALEQLLKSVQAYVSDIQTITVLYEATQNMAPHYKAVSDKYLDVQFIHLGNKNTLAVLTSIIESSTKDHLILARDIVVLKSPLRCSDCIMELERTFAYGFYFNFAHQKKPFYYPNINKEVIPYQSITQTLCAWKFNCGKYALYNNIDMTLFRKKDLIKRLITMPAGLNTSLAAFLDAWHTNASIDGHLVGLFLSKPVLGGKRTSILTHAVEKPILSAQQLLSVYRQQILGNKNLTEELMDLF